MTQSPAGTPAAPDSPPPFRNYVEAVLEALAADPGRTVLTDPDGCRTTAGTLYEDVYRTAAELAARGVGRGSTLAVLSGNRPEALVTRYAANLLGARVAFLHEVIHTQLAPEVVARIGRSVGTTLWLVDPALRDLAGSLLSQQDLAPVLFLGPGGPGGPEEDLAACAARRPGTPVASAARPEDDWCIRMTGGSTGTPKNVCVTFEKYLRVVTDRAALMRSRPPRPGEDGEALCFLACASIAHSAGTTVDGVLLAGGRVVLHRGFDPGAVLDTIERERVTDVWLLSPMLGQVLDHPRAGTAGTGSLRWLGYGGHLLSPARAERAAEVFGPVLHGWYGQTEVGLICEAGPHEHRRIGRMGQITAGRPIPGVELVVRDAAGRPLPVGEVGEIRVRSWQLMSGYWEQPALSAEVLSDGWLRTGDAGYLDEEGYLFLCGRYKEVIKLAGSHQVFPAELEGFLLTHPDVEECMVFGVRRPDDAEEVHAAIVPAPGRTLDPAVIREFVTSRKGPLYAPSELHLLPEMPLNAVGKPDKKQVQDRLGLTRAGVTVY
ncbi:fatty acid CoA ligase [Streptomyces albus]|uniref:Fatty acid CoA ligase n=1 Tax=Streptomyces albus (strain ATCC 21838 / DSM 41398 / FERM P-419 / JCM 4703 / NBRC 107858) TaxID=1081613 RepID=A0A0B5F4G8_STRA4|nr:fatty acid CoA ligase [Streptomyces albus]AOU80100.1 fatty acid CoA ligase [Streptomyces albus]